MDAERRHRRIVACDKCGLPNDRWNESNYCSRCASEYQVRVGADPETRPIGAPQSLLTDDERPSIGLPRDARPIAVEVVVGPVSGCVLGQPVHLSRCPARKGGACRCEQLRDAARQYRRNRADAREALRRFIVSGAR